MLVQRFAVHPTVAYSLVAGTPIQIIGTMLTGAWYHQSEGISRSYRHWYGREIRGGSYDGVGVFKVSDLESCSSLKTV